MGKGKVIVLEGLDGCGKTTQLDLVLGYLKENRITCRSVSFPNYEALSGKLVQQYLTGEIPADGRNGAYAASAIYAADRYISYMTDWKGFYESGGVILAGRYTTSNAIYQLTKLPPEEHEYFLNWLCDFEYGKLGLPEPDVVVYLDMPVETSQILLNERYRGDEAKKDIHESNLDFMRACRNSALYAADQCGWNVVNCADGIYPLPIEDVYSLICDCLKGIVSNVGIR